MPAAHHEGDVSGAVGAVVDRGQRAHSPARRADHVSRGYGRDRLDGRLRTVNTIRNEVLSSRRRKRGRCACSSGEGRFGGGWEAVGDSRKRDPMSGSRLVDVDAEWRVSTDELRPRLDDPGLTIVDVRPLAAYNGWNLLGRRARRPHPGRGRLPEHLAGSRRPRRGSEAAPGQGRHRRARDRAVRRPPRRGVGGANATRRAGPGARSRLRPGLGGVGRRRDAPRRAPPAPRQARAHRVAAGAPRREHARGRARRRVPALPRQLRRSRGVRGEPPARGVLPRHEPAREPGRLEPANARGARGGGPLARHHARHHRHPVRAGHRGRPEREVARTSGRPDRGDPRGDDPSLLRRRRRPPARRRLRRMGSGRQPAGERHPHARRRRRCSERRSPCGPR